MEPERGSKTQADGEPGPCETLDIRDLVAEHYAAIYGYAFRLSGSHADAEDIAQQTFLIAHQKLHQVREAHKADRWLFAVARSCYLKSRRRQRPAPAANLELNVDQIPEDLQVEAGIDEEKLQAAINQLDDAFKVVVMMFYFEERSYKEIASELGIAMGTVMSRLARAKGRLRHFLFEDANSRTEARESPLLSTAASQLDHPLRSTKPAR